MQQNASTNKEVDKAISCLARLVSSFLISTTPVLFHCSRNPVCLEDQKSQMSKV